MNEMRKLMEAMKHLDESDFMKAIDKRAEPKRYMDLIKYTHDDIDHILWKLNLRKSADQPSDPEDYIKEIEKDLKGIKKRFRHQTPNALKRGGMDK